MFKNRTPLEIILIFIVIVNSIFAVVIGAGVVVGIAKDGVYHKTIHIEVSK